MSMISMETMTMMMITLMTTMVTATMNTITMDHCPAATTTKRAHGADQTTVTTQLTVTHLGMERLARGATTAAVITRLLPLVLPALTTVAGPAPVVVGTPLLLSMSTWNGARNNNNPVCSTMAANLLAVSNPTSLSVVASLWFMLTVSSMHQGLPVRRSHKVWNLTTTEV